MAGVNNFRFNESPVDLLCPWHSGWTSRSARPPGSAPGRQSRRQRNPGRRTTATRDAAGAAHGAEGIRTPSDRSSTGSGSPSWSVGVSTVGQPADPEGVHRGVERGSGVAAKDVSSIPSSVSQYTRGSSSVAVRMTTVPPAAAAAWTPGSSVSASRRPSARRRREGRRRHRSGWRGTRCLAPAATTERTWRSAGATPSPSINSRRALPIGAVDELASRPQTRQAGDQLDPAILVVGEAPGGGPRYDLDIEDLDILL